MVASGEELDFHEMITLRTAQPAVVQLRQLRTFALAVSYDVALVLLLVANQVILQMALGRIGLRAAQRPVFLVDFPIPEHCAYSLHRLGGLGQDAYPAHRPVQSVRYAQVHLPRLGIAPGYECLV